MIFAVPSAISTERMESTTSSLVTDFRYTDADMLASLGVENHTAHWKWFNSSSRTSLLLNRLSDSAIWLLICSFKSLRTKPSPFCSLEFTVLKHLRKSSFLKNCLFGFCCLVCLLSSSYFSIYMCLCVLNEN